MHFKSLKIENFRAIEKLEISDFGQVNVFIGKNNSGKTTLLESLFLISGPTNPRLPVFIHHLRDLVLEEDSNFLFLFRDQDESSLPVITALREENEFRKLTLKPISASEHLDHLLHEPNIQFGNVSSSSAPQIEGLMLEFEHSNKGNKPKILMSEIRLKSSEFKIADGYNETYEAYFLNNTSQSRDLEEQFSELVIKKQLDPIIAILKKVDQRIMDIRLGTRGKIFIDLGQEKLLPLNIMGDGFRRVLYYAVMLAARPNSVLLIDEIENELHHKNLSLLWETLLKSAKKFNSQIFATTHSYEALSVLAQTPTDDVMVKVYRIENNNGTHSVVDYSIEELRGTINANWELR